jgi:hypothetical protein
VLYLPEIVVVAAPPLPHPARTMTKNTAAGASVIFILVLLVGVCHATHPLPSWRIPLVGGGVK